MSETTFCGGCQCGAVRFRAHGVLTASICHCRMCQKAFGSYYAPLVQVKAGGVAWTRGAPSYFQSSNAVRRGFCSACGTPLTYEAGDGISLAAGAFDDPTAFPPVIQWGAEGMIGFVDHLHELPLKGTLDDVSDAPFLADLVSYQHPDRDTDHWEIKR